MMDEMWASAHQDRWSIAQLRPPEALGPYHHGSQGSSDGTTLHCL